MTDSKKQNEKEAVPEVMKGMAQGSGMEQTLKDLNGSHRSETVTPDTGGTVMEEVLRDAYSRS